MGKQNDREKRNTEYRCNYPTAFPRLDEHQLAVLEEFAHRKKYHDGEYLLRAGETEFKFHIIISGRVEIVDRSSGTGNTILVHEPGELQATWQTSPAGYPMWMQ